MKPTPDRAATYVPAFTLEPEKRAAEVNAPPTVQAPNFINDIAAGKVELPTIPSVVQKLIVALRDPDVDTRKIGEALAQDPVLSAKVLRLANSSFFGGQRSMASIDAAIALIGIQALNRLVVASGVSSSFAEIPGIDLPSFWRDALFSATAANKLAGRLGADPEAAYVCGLLHATGHLILCQTYSDIAKFMFAGYASVRGAELAAIEAESFGIDHPTVGALWVETIGFPQPVADTIRKCRAAARAERRAARPRAAQRLRGRGRGGPEERRRDGARGAARGRAGEVRRERRQAGRDVRQALRRAARDTADVLSRTLPRGVARAGSALRVVGNDVVLLGRVVARDDRARGLARAEVDRLVRDAGRDEQEIARLADDRGAEPLAVARLDPAFEDVDRGLVAAVRVRIGARAGRDHDQVHRQPPGADRRAGDADEVRQALLREDLACGPDRLHFAAGRCFHRDLLQCLSVPILPLTCAADRRRRCRAGSRPA